MSSGAIDSTKARDAAQAVAGRRRGDGGSERGTALRVPALDPTFEVSCPGCGTPLDLGGVHFAGMPIFVEGRCPECDRNFVLDWPSGHALLHPAIVDADSGAAFFDGSDWYAKALLRCLASRGEPSSARIEIQEREPGNKTAVVVNCLDFIYGHGLLKLLSGVHFLGRDDVDAIFIVQKRFAWLVPSSARAVVEVDQPLRDGDRWIEGLDAAVKGLVGGYERVQIAPVQSQPAVSGQDLAMLGKGFLPSAFWNAADDDAAQITFVLREDRVWLGHERLWGALERVSIVPAALRRRLLIANQNRRLARLVRAIAKVMPQVRFVAVGLGRTGRLPVGVQDLRRASITPEDELAWCAQFARSRLVIGVHGSHMLLPSALAGAVIDLLPEHKLPNIGQDLIIAGAGEREPKLCLFRYRILPQSTRPGIVGDAATSILRHADYHHFNMVRNRDATGDGWRRPISWRELP